MLKRKISPSPLSFTSESRTLDAAATSHSKGGKGLNIPPTTLLEGKEEGGRKEHPKGKGELTFRDTAIAAVPAGRGGHGEKWKRGYFAVFLWGKMEKRGGMCIPFDEVAEEHVPTTDAHCGKLVDGHKIDAAGAKAQPSCGVTAEVLREHAAHVWVSKGLLHYLVDPRIVLREKGLGSKQRKFKKSL